MGAGRSSVLPNLITFAHAGGAHSSSSGPDPISPMTTFTSGASAGQGVIPSVSTTTTWGRSRSRHAAAIPSPMSVPPPPTRSICCMVQTLRQVATAASHARTDNPSLPTARSTPRTSAIARASCSSPIDPEVSTTTATSGVGLRIAGSTTLPFPTEPCLREGRMKL
jgi:hypothetical protein